MVQTNLKAKVYVINSEKNVFQEVLTGGVMARDRLRDDGVPVQQVWVDHRQ